MLKYDVSTASFTFHYFFLYFHLSCGRYNFQIDFIVSYRDLHYTWIDSSIVGQWLWITFHLWREISPEKKKHEPNTIRKIMGAFFHTQCSWMREKSFLGAFFYSTANTVRDVHRLQLHQNVRTFNSKYDTKCFDRQSFFVDRCFVINLF